MKAPVASHTFLDVFTRCPKQAFHRFVAKDVPFQESEALTWGNRVHKSLEKRVGEGLPLPEGMEAYEKYATSFDAHQGVKTELSLGMTIKGEAVGFFDKDVWLRGKIDVLDRRNQVGFIADWKTGRKWEKPDELQVHALLVKTKFPDLQTIKGAFVWLKEDQIGTVYDLSDFSATYDKVAGIMEQAGALLDKGAEWPAQENKLCGWCSVHTCKFNPQNEANK